MIAIAITTAFQVKTISMPSRSSIPPSAPRRLSSISRISPVATGGITSGSDTSVSTSDASGKLAARQQPREQDAGAAA